MAVVRRQAAHSIIDTRQDLVQDVYESVTKALKQYDGNSSSLKTFVSKVAQRTCIDIWRHGSTMSRTGKNQHVEHHDNTDENNAVLVSSLNPEEDLSKAQFTHLLRIALRRLSKECQKLLELRFYDGLKYRQIADRLGKKENSVNVQVNRCLEYLREAYAKLQFEEQGQ